MTWQAYYVDGDPEAGDHRLCVVQDLSDEHWEDCLLVLERERHWLAGDLHDGPCQVAAAEALKEESTSLPAIQELMEWLRSPLYSDATPERAFRDLVRRHLSEVSFLWNSPLAEWSPRLLLCYRLLQEVLEEISERCTSLELEWWLQPGQCWSGGLCGADCSTYQPSPSIAHRLELFQGSLRTTASGLTVDLG